MIRVIKRIVLSLIICMFCYTPSFAIAPIDNFLTYCYQLQNRETAYTNTAVNIRSEPDTNSKIVSTVSKNTKVEKIRDVGNWFEVVWDNRICYIFGSYVSNNPVKEVNYLGKYKITGYCSCARCCGKSSGLTASGTKPQANHTIAAPSNLSFGTKLIINGKTYTVEDRGGAVKGNVIDMYFNSHNEAIAWGTKYLDVYI